MNISTFNEFGEVDDILLWMTQLYGVKIGLDFRGYDVRSIRLSEEAWISVQAPQNGEYKCLMRKENFSKEYSAKSRQEFFNILEDLIKASL